MKYKQHLTEKINPLWQKYYIEFHQLKQQFKLKNGEQWKTKDEEGFKIILEKEISKVCQFLQLQIKTSLKQLQSIESTTSTIQLLQQKEKEKEKEKIATLVFHIHDLTNYLYTNKIGLEDMVLKHDQYCSTTQFTLKHHYEHHIQSQFQSYEQQLDFLFLRLSQLYDLFRPSSSPLSTNTPSSSCSSPINNNECTTFWVHPNHMNELKAILLFYLPIITLPTDHQQRPNNQCNTVYFDNMHMDLYKEKIKTCNHHHQKQFLDQEEENEKTLLLLKCQWYKDDISEMEMEIQELQKNQLIKKSHKMDGSALLSPSSSSFSHDPHTTTTTITRNNNNNDQDNEFFYWIQQKKLIPQGQTTCQRTIYYQKETNLQLYLDTNIQFYERMNNPQQPSSSSSSFDYGVLTILNPTTTSFPYWLKEIVSSHLVYPVPHFSFYIHMQSLLYTNQLPLHPWWLSIQERDLLLLKNNKKRIGLSRSMINLQQQQPDHAIIHMEETNGNEKGKGIYYQFKYWIKEKRIMMKQQKDQTMVFKNNKLTEPKTHFANERTFITWLQLCATFLVIALSLINHGDWTSRTMGSILIFICCILAMYALGRFQYRTWQLRTRKYVLRYDDVFGPTCLCLTLIFAMSMNLYFRYPLILEAIQSL
ncbi:hypothetical protein BJ944DRAFT_253553 [Cunninghamella echinulata]|nr:hypothetical protein BJ944DRAFT_253553 [Cunninghamella echinulata]